MYPCRDQNYFKAGVAALQNFLLDAAAEGLGTCWMNAVSICQDAVKKEPGLMPELVLVDGGVPGYPVEGSPVNRVPRARLPVGDVTDWRE